MLLALVLGTTTSVAAALDLELRAAVDALVRLERYSFHAEGERTPATPDARPVAFVADGSFELGRPLRLEPEESVGLPAPHELVALLDRHTESVTRIDEDDPRSGGVLTFECVLDEAGSRALAPRGAIVAIRVVLDGARRSIDQLIVEPVAARRAREAADGTKPAAEALGLFLHYQVRRPRR